MLARKIQSGSLFNPGRPAVLAFTARELVRGIGFENPDRRRQPRLDGLRMRALERGERGGIELRVRVRPAGVAPMTVHASPFLIHLSLRTYPSIVIDGGIRGCRPRETHAFIIDQDRKEQSLGCPEGEVVTHDAHLATIPAGSLADGIRVAVKVQVIEIQRFDVRMMKMAFHGGPDARQVIFVEAIAARHAPPNRLGQLVAKEASKRLGVPFGIIDLSLAPTPVLGDSVAMILQAMGLEYVGAPGTTAALAILNDNVKKGGVMASSFVGGLSGAFIPVSEDYGMIKAVEANALTLEKLEAMTCVCSVGLDMIAIPGDTSESTISGIIADEMAIGMINNKTTAVRIIPVHGKKAGEKVVFGGLLGYAPIMEVNNYDCSAFINRGGRIPPPIHSFKN